MITAAQREELRSKAHDIERELIHEGKWVVGNGRDGDNTRICDGRGAEVGRGMWPEVADYIAALSPDVVLGLLDALDDAAYSASMTGHAHPTMHAKVLERAKAAEAKVAALESRLEKEGPLCICGFTEAAHEGCCYDFEPRGGTP